MVAPKGGGRDWTCPKCGKTERVAAPRPPARPHRVRNDVRYPVEIPIHVAGLDLAYEGRSVDLSVHGAQLEMPLKRLRPGRIATVTLTLPGRGRSAAELILPGDIRWTQTLTESGSMAGIKFVHTPTSLQLLSQLLSALDDGITHRLPHRAPPPPPPHVCSAARREKKPRRESRQRVAFPVIVSLADGAITGEVCDLSKGGLLLRSPYAVAPGKRVIVRLESPDVPVILPIEATVRWLRIDTDDTVAGLAFDRAPDAHIVRLFFEALRAEARPQASGHRTTSWRKRIVDFKPIG